VTDANVEAEVVAIRDRLAALAAEPDGPSVAAELGAIRAQLRQLATAYDEIAERLAELLGLPPD